MMGYLYQVRYSLYRALLARSEVQIFLEGLDDIHFESEGRPEELIQTKYHSSPANLTDSSSDVWKTIRVWSYRIKKGEIDVSSTHLYLVTNELPSEDSIAMYLGQGSKRNEAKALEQLEKVAQTSENKELKTAFGAFNSLTTEQRKALVSSTVIVTGGDSIEDLVKNIGFEVRYVIQANYLNDFVQRLEGWWFSKAVISLKTGAPIFWGELQRRILDLSEEYRSDSLPIHDFEGDLPSVEEIVDRDRGFVEQLKIIRVNSPRLTKAISDYYRAFTQKSKWIRNGNLGFEEMNKYETKLIDEWVRIFYAIKDEPTNLTNAEAMEKAGREVFNRIDSLGLNIRSRVTEPFIMRGTYHNLANRGEVGWHPEFEERLKHLFEKMLETVNQQNENP